MRQTSINDTTATALKDCHLDGTATPDAPSYLRTRCQGRRPLKPTDNVNVRDTLAIEYSNVRARSTSPLLVIRRYCCSQSGNSWLQSTQKSVNRVIQLIHASPVQIDERMQFGDVSSFFDYSVRPHSCIPRPFCSHNSNFSFKKSKNTQGRGKAQMV
jgi:hypothetical protein